MSINQLNQMKSKLNVILKGEKQDKENSKGQDKIRKRVN